MVGLPARGWGATDAAGLEFFEKKIRPVLVKRCYPCHSAEAKKAKGGLLLDSRAAMLRGGESGPALVPGDPAASLLVKAIRYSDGELEMPPDQAAQLAPHEVADFETWVRMGAPDPRESENEAAPARPAIDWEAARRHWSFRPIERRAPPPARDGGWSRTPVDRFLAAKLRERGLRPAPDTDKATLLRRATFDLTGLPPTPDEIGAFLADGSPQAFARVVDRLLASRHYGERWGRHWLDVVRYADTAGDQADYPVPEAWRYRNYVIDAFNRDKPFDRFVAEQIAGDLMPGRSEAERQERLVATGFVALSRRFHAESEKYGHLTIEDTIDTIGRGLLGLSLSCARCHDHKFDPVPNEDYYALYGIFASTRYPHPGSETLKRPRDLVVLLPSERAKAALEPYEEYRKQVQALEEQMAKLKKSNPGEEAVRVFRKAIEAYEATMPAVPWAFAVGEKPAENARVHQGGDPRSLGPEVPRGFLQIAGGQRLDREAKGSGRLQLAGWLTDPRNPLLARVMANRIWLHHFGKGLVRTPNDFGTRGEAPSHPELLDHLAARFVEGGWSVKAMHRLIMLSRAYRMAARDDAQAARVDPENRLLWSFNRRRLDAEALRDALLLVSGDLDRTPGKGHPFPPAYRWKFTGGDPFLGFYESPRRSVYLVSQRIKRAPFFDLFDGADANLSTGERPTTTTALQALFFMNSGFVAERSRSFAGRMLGAAATDRARIRLAHLAALGRPPTATEEQEGLAYLARFADPRRAWESYGRALFASNEFAFLD